MLSGYIPITFTDRQSALDAMRAYPVIWAIVRMIPSRGGFLVQARGSGERCWHTLCVYGQMHRDLGTRTLAAWAIAHRTVS